MNTWYQLEGLTGSGKTAVLQRLGALGAQVLDLEELSGHKGSAFGKRPHFIQMAQTAYEKKLQYVIDTFTEGPVFIESKPPLLGKLYVPKEIALAWKSPHVIYIETSKETRTQHLVNVYGKRDISFLKSSLYNLKNRLSPLVFSKALEFLEHKDLYGCAEVLLDYYDASQRYVKPDNPHMEQTYQGAQKTAEIIYRKIIAK